MSLKQNKRNQCKIKRKPLIYKSGGGGGGEAVKETRLPIKEEKPGQHQTPPV